MRFLTAGFSHGEAIGVIIDDFPANVVVDFELLNRNLRRRQSGYGRGGRQKIEKDSVQIISGVVKGKTVGSPILGLVYNKDNSIDRMPSVFCPRPGHADLSGLIKFDQEDVRHILERASARETVARVVAGSFAQMILREVGIKWGAFVRKIGSVEACDDEILELEKRGWDKFFSEVDTSDVFCPSKEVSEKMKQEIDKAKEKKDTVGGVVEVWIEGVPVGLGSFTQWDRRLDARLSFAVMSVPAIKAVEIGNAIASSSMYGSQAHDEIFLSEDNKIYRKTNNAGGIEGGMTNGERIVVRAYMKPIATVGEPLNSIDIRDLSETKAAVERFDTCAVPAASVVVEAMVCWAIAEVLVEKFGGDEIGDLKEFVSCYTQKRRLI